MIDRRTFFVVAALALAAAIATAAQDRPASELRFDTASIRPSAGAPAAATDLRHVARREPGGTASPGVPWNSPNSHGH